MDLGIDKDDVFILQSGDVLAMDDNSASALPLAASRDDDCLVLGVIFQSLYIDQSVVWYTDPVEV